MAAPSSTPRQLPVGFKMPDGYQCLITFANKPALQLWEKMVKPPGIDGGEKIPTTTMHNQKARTYAARHLIDFMDSTFAAAYDPDAYLDLMLLVNKEQSITVWFPDGSNIAFWGFLQKFEPGDLKEGEMPEATCTVAPTNTDPTTTAEALPVFTPAPGT